MGASPSLLLVQKTFLVSEDDPIVYNLSCHQGAPENCNATHHPLCAAIVIQGKWARVI
jgi:hypothetical protein